MFKVILDYPNEADERKILDRMGRSPARSNR